MSAVFWQEAARRDLIEHYVYLTENVDQEVADRFLASDDLTERAMNMPKAKSCPFCSINPAQILNESASAVVLTDTFPVSLGHCLIVPRRHVGSWFETRDDERREMLTGLDDARASIQRLHRPAGYNIGINDGPAAGQTIAHVHIHLIPRYEGDVPDPRGGIRLVLAGRADYWSKKK